jgi:acetylornithine deacetylase
MITFDPLKALSGLINIVSLSKSEEDAAQYMESILSENGVAFFRDKNNIWAQNKYFKEGKYTILLNSHIDTVKPNSGYSKDPYKAIVEDRKLFGLGSNDAGGALMCLLGTFLHFFNQENLPFNLIFAASAEEEISGKNGMEYLYNYLPKIDFAIIGEPTLMQISIAERGLMVLDCKAVGQSGHAARKEGVNAIYKAIDDINWFNTYVFPKHSEELGGISMNVTVINAGSQHNVVPAECSFVVDVRVNDQYSNQEVLDIITDCVSCEVRARSTRLNSSGVNENHPIRKVAEILSINTYGSPTLSDQALIPCESIKMGPGDSARSHTADEFIYVDELESAIPKYISVLNSLGAHIS